MMLDGTLTEMCITVHCWLEDSVSNAVAIRFHQARADPTGRKTLGKRSQVNLPKTIRAHFGEVQISQNEIHLYARMTSGGVSM
jgi:hypothetical protein